jgi:hypothetical protein
MININLNRRGNIIWRVLPMASKYQELKKDIDELSDAINLNKLMNNYFNKWVFRIFLIALIGIFFFAWYLDGFATSYYYLECKSSQCLNPFYVCQTPQDYFGGCIKDLDTFPNVPKEIKNLCDTSDFCKNKFLYDGFKMGAKPNSILLNMKWVIFILAIVSFSINHLLYVFKFKKEVKERVNK